MKNGLGHWLTFVTEPVVDWRNNRIERTLSEQMVMRKIFRSLRSDEGVKIHKAITMMVARKQRRGLYPSGQLQSMLGGQNSHHRERHLYHPNLEHAIQLYEINSQTPNYEH